MPKTRPPQLTPLQRRELESVVLSAASKRGHALRAKVILLSADGLAGNDIAARLQLSTGQVSRIRQRFERGSVFGLVERPRAGRRDHAVSGEKVALIVTLAASPPPPGRARWSTRLIGTHVGLSSATVAKVLRASRGAD
jgi:transposase